MSETAYRMPGYRMADTLMGDTVQRVAERELGDAARWPELVALNDLDPPYIVDGLSALENAAVATAAARVVVAGQRIKVPASMPPGGVADPADIYGTDLILAGRLLAEDPETGDLATVTDLDNLKQALRHRLATHEGELVWHRRYGNPLHAMVGQGSGPVHNQLARALAERTLRSDSRVASVPSIEATLTGEAVGLDAVVEATDGRSLPVGKGE